MTKKMVKKENRKQKDKKIERLFEEMIEECEKCESHELCDIIKKLKIVHFAIKDYDKVTSKFRLKTGIIILIEAVLIFLILINTKYFLYMISMFLMLEIYGYFIKHKYRKNTINHLEKLGIELGIPEEKQKELRRSLEGKPSLTAEKMMNCKLRKERGLNYCVSCPDSYSCASGLPNKCK